MFRPVFRPNPAVWGLFLPLFAAHSPETPPFSPRRPTVFPAKPRRKLLFPRRGRPVFPVSTRHCAPAAARNAPAERRFPANPPAFAPGIPVFPAVRPRVARDPARFEPEVASRVPAARPGCAPLPGARLPLGLRPVRLHRFAVVKRVPPRGASIPGSDFQETAAQPRTKFRKIQGLFPACHVAA